MFIVTAQVVKPVNRDDLPKMPNVENLKKASLLGVDRKEDQINGPSGFYHQARGDFEYPGSASTCSGGKTASPPVKEATGTAGVETKVAAQSKSKSKRQLLLPRQKTVSKP